MADYDVKDVWRALLTVGVEPYDCVFTHCRAAPLGEPEAGLTKGGIFRTLYDGFMRALPDGTLVVPTFTYSYPRGEPFDREKTPTDLGILSEGVRRLDESMRSDDPIFSVAAVGRDRRYFTRNVSSECFGTDSFWDRFHQANGIIVNVNLDAGSTFLHYVERWLDVDYRKDRRFDGVRIEDGGPVDDHAIYFSRDLDDPDARPDFTDFDRLARERGLVETAPLGRGEIVAIRARDAFNLVADTLPEHPRLLVA